MPFSFANLKAELRKDLWPSGERATHRAIHDKYFAAACQQLQRWVDCLKANNVDLIHQCSTYFHCGLTIFDYVPGSIIRSIKVVDRVDPSTGKSNANFPIDWCTEVTYNEVNFCDIETFVSENQNGCCGVSAMAKVFDIPAGYCGKKTFPKPDDEEWNHLNALPAGYHRAQDSTDSDCGRALKGVWAKHRGRIHILPWIQSTESIVMEYDGSKIEWLDEDLIPDHPEYKKAIKHWVGMMHAKVLEQDVRAAGNEKRRYDTALQALMYDCREGLRVRDCHGNDRRSVARAAVLPASVTESGVEETATIGNQSTCESISPVAMDPPIGAKVIFPTKLVLYTETPNCEIYFTIDGSTPTADSFKYTGPIEIMPADNIKAVAYKGGCYSAVSASAFSEQNTDSDFWRMDGEADKVGAWLQFEPNGVDDLLFRLDLMLGAETEIRQVDLFRLGSDGIWGKEDIWSTKQQISPTELKGAVINPYPLGIFDGNDQINSAYMDTLGNFSAMLHDLNLFADPVGDVYFYKLILHTNKGTFYCITDGKALGTQTVSDPCPVDADAVSESQANGVLTSIIEINGVNVSFSFSYSPTNKNWIFVKGECDEDPDLFATSVTGGYISLGAQIQIAGQLLGSRFRVCYTMPDSYTG